MQKSFTFNQHTDIIAVVKLLDSHKVCDITIQLWLQVSFGEQHEDIQQFQLLIPPGWLKFACDLNRRGALSTDLKVFLNTCPFPNGLCRRVLKLFLETSHAACRIRDIGAVQLTHSFPGCGMFN